jgi:RNA-binding protein YlmH
LFWGGFEGAERVYLGISAEVQPVAEDFPIAAVRFSWRFEALTHRDFLGALLSLGLRRDKIGDIVVGDGECRVVLDAGISDFVRQNLTKVGGGGVSCVAAGLTDIKKRQAFGAVSDTIASPRLDCIVAALADKSRLDAGKLILNGFVSIDFETAEDTAAKLNEGSTVSIRGHGRFIIDGIGPATKKGRLRLEARKYL